ncbi:hypothetical protein ACFTXB_01640 [Streptomyces sp. NPDC057074]
MPDSGTTRLGPVLCDLLLREQIEEFTRVSPPHRFRVDVGIIPTV